MEVASNTQVLSTAEVPRTTVATMKGPHTAPSISPAVPIGPIDSGSLNYDPILTEGAVNEGEAIILNNDGAGSGLEAVPATLAAEGSTVVGDVLATAPEGAEASSVETRLVAGPTPTGTGTETAMLANDGAFGSESAGTECSDSDEDVISLASADVKSDPLFHAKVKRRIGRKYFRGCVESVEQVAGTGERLYLVRYSDGDLEHYTADEVRHFAA